jgi:hypothetical protein
VGRVGQRRYLLQHNTANEVGTVVDSVVWPYEHTATMLAKGAGEGSEMTFPAGSWFMGVVWDEGAWTDLVKSGKVRGLSMGGRARRNRVVANTARNPVSEFGLEAAWQAAMNGHRMVLG